MNTNFDRKLGTDFGNNAGFWIDNRSKRDIGETHLGPDTCENHHFYDPLLTPANSPVSLTPPFDYRAASGSRPWLLGLHSWRFADYWILRHLRAGDSAMLPALDSVVADYLDAVWDRPDRATISEFVLGDTSVAARAAVMAFLLGSDGQHGFRVGDPVRLRRALDEHMRHAIDDRNFNSNNHGVFNDLSLLLAFGNLAELRHSFELQGVIGRLRKVFIELQINHEYIHLEHTPAYAVLWILLGDRIARVMGAMFADDPETDGFLREVRAATSAVKANLYWFVTPQGALVNLGEQGREQVLSWVQEFAGEPGLRVFPDSGYAAYKSTSSYLMMVGAYHTTKLGRTGYRASAHKQRDELHLLWSEAMGNILVDSGFKSYDFDDARRYVV